jgi:hypothetical protein
MSAPTASPATPTPPAAPEIRPPAPPSYWLWVLCLLGVDYFSTLAYQPSISFQVAGRLAPLATVAVVLVTLCCAVPVYWYVAGRSAHGSGSIALLEQVVHGWRGKTLVLGLLGFAATDFVMIKTLSLADAAEHVLHNSIFERGHTLQDMAQAAKETSQQYLGDRFTGFFNEQLVVTMILTVVGFFFWFVLRKGFNRNVMAVAVPIVAAYLLLNAVLLGAGLWRLLAQPERLARWFEQVDRGDWLLDGLGGSEHGWLLIGLLCLAFLPQLALGLSGFEMSLIVMPQVRGGPADNLHHPRGRIRNTRKVLVAAALIMSVYLLGSVLVTTTLIPPEALALKGPADNRALAYLAHGGRLAAGAGGGPAETLGPLFGPVFGSLYDIVTVSLLCLAGTSVMTALAVLLPQFLLRFGMELKWAHKWGVLLGLFALVNLAVTIYFQASVHAQRGAYATGVMVLMCSAGVVSFLSVRQRRQAHHRRAGWRYLPSALVFTVIAAGVVLQSPGGLLIAFGFIVTVLSFSVFARAMRCDELRTVGFDFVDAESKFLWDSLCMADFPVLVPHRPGRHARDLKERAIRADHQLDPDKEIVFLEVEVDDPSNFYQRLLVEVMPEGKRFVIKVTRCVSVAHAIAAVALEMSRLSRPPGVHFGWSEMHLLAASWSYLAFGEGNVPWKVRELIREAEPDPARQPRVIIG